MTTALAPGTWTLDPRATKIGFEAKLLFGMKAKGTFSRYDAAIAVGPSAAESSVRLTVWADSLRTGNKMRDGHLLADNTFAPAKFPSFEFSSTEVAETATGLDITGNLRIRDVTKPVTFHAVRDTDAGPHRYKAETMIGGGDFGFTRGGTKKPVLVVIDAILIPA